MNDTDAAIVRRPTRFADWAGIIAAAAGAAVLLGWALDLPALKKLLIGRGTMKPMAALGLMLLGSSLTLAAEPIREMSPRGLRIWLSGILSILAVAIGASTLTEHVSGWDLGIDLWLFPGAARADVALYPGRMAFQAASAMTLLGVGILCCAARGARAHAAAEAIALVVGVFGTFGIAGQVYGAEALYLFPDRTALSLPLGIALVLLAVGLVALRPGDGFFAALASRRPGGVMGRRLLPAVVALPFLLGWSRLATEGAGWIDERLGTAFVALLNALSLSLLVWWMARRLNRVDAERQAADAARRGAMADSERRYRTLAESLPQLVWTCRSDGSCDYVSPQAVAYSGLPLQSQLGDGWIAQIHPDDRVTVAAQWQRSVQSGEPFDIEFRLRRNDGAFRWFRSLAVAVRGDGGGIVEWFGTNTDIDDRKHARTELQRLTADLEERVRDRTRELQAAKEQAESADRLKTEFIMGMSHELRTPLNAIIGFTGTMLMELPGPLTAEQEQQLKMVQASGRHLLLIISDMLDVARLEAGQVTLARERVYLNPLVRGIAVDLGVSAEDKGLTLAADVPDAPVVVETDPRALRQILFNLASNAIKFTKQGTVTLRLRALDDRIGRGIELVVEDTGVGIAQGDRHKLFRKFGQLGSAGTTSPGGTGLGLYLSRTLAERLGGWIDVESEPGHGSRFTLHLPDDSVAAEGVVA